MQAFMRTHYLPFVLALVVITVVWFSAMPAVGIAAQPTVNLGTASTFGIPAGSTITNTGPTTVSGTAGGNIGLHPGDGTVVATFPGQELVTLNGTVHLYDAVAEQAKLDLVVAHNDAAGRTTDETITGDLGGRTLTTWGVFVYSNYRDYGGSHA